MTTISFQKFFAAASLSALAMSVVACSSNSGSNSQGTVQAKAVGFNPLVTLSVTSGSMPADSGVPFAIMHKYEVADESRLFSTSTTELADGSSSLVSKDGIDYQIADSCEGSSCGEIVMTITRKTVEKSETRAFLFVRTSATKFSQVCSRDGLSAEPSKAVETLMSECDPTPVIPHDKNLSSSPANQGAAQSKNDSAPSPSSK